MSHTRRRAAGPAVLGVQRHAPHSRRTVFSAKSKDRGRPVHAPQGTHHGFRHGEVRAPDSQQTLPRDEFLRLALRAGRPCEGQPLEQLEAQDRAGARDAGHGADPEERRKPEGLHGLEGFFSSQATYEVDTVSRRKRATVTFRTRQGEPYRIDSVSYEFQDNFLEQIVLPDTVNTLLHTGDIYDVSVLDAERERIAAYLKERGTTISRSTTSPTPRGCSRRSG